MDTVLIILIVILAIGLIALGYYVNNLKSEQKIKEAEVERIQLDLERKTKELQEEFKLKQKEADIALKEQLHQKKQELELEMRDKRSELNKFEKRLSNKEDALENKLNSLEAKERDLRTKQEKIIEKEDHLADLIMKQMQELERISGITAEEAKAILLSQLEDDLKVEQAQLIREYEQKTKETCQEKSREILSTAMQRCAIDQVTESTVSVVNLPNDEMKGRIIGREGRNIRALETLTGVDLIIDDTPEAVVLSSFDPVRREIAKIALEKLIGDGRIHPVRIEEMVEKSKEEVNQRMQEEGERAAFELGVMNLHPELTKALGRLYYRTSYGQNVLKHSLEVGHLAGMLAAEINADVSIAKRAGLLHDVGKSLDQSQEGTHISLGVDLARRCGESDDIIHAIEAHHDDVVANSVIAVLVKIADTLSAARPGARRDTLEIYIKRLQKLEEIATSYNGIKRTFAVQAGREVRVMVIPTAFDDAGASKLARDIANRIEGELDYPGQIRVTVVREVRSTEIAK
ncbi:MAG: ribonuclease Y [Cyanobacteriota bacterium]